MTDSPITLPFNVTGLFGGFAEVKGLAKANESDLILEFVIEENVLQVFKSGLKEVRIPRAEIESVRLKRGWFGARVRICVKSMKWLADLPGCDRGEINLHVSRPDRDRAADFVKVVAGA